MRFSLSFIAVLLAVSIVGDVHAAEMKLWPNQRAAHQSEMNDKAIEYKQRGTDYVNHTYATGGEEPVPAADNVFAERDYSLPGSAASTSQNANDIKARKVDVNEVADIIRGGGMTQPPEPPVGTFGDTAPVLGKRGPHQ